MNRNLSAAGYDSWYATARGAWMGNREAEALIRLGEIGPDRRVLDVGCGSGWFTRRFAATGASVTGLDNDAAMLDYAHIQDASIPYISGDMLALPFPDKSFDVITAVTSLCFVPDEHCALAEIVRVARRRIVLGLLHRDSLLYLRKHGRGAYAGARWHHAHGRSDACRRPAGRSSLEDRNVVVLAGRAAAGAGTGVPAGIKTLRRIYGGGNRAIDFRLTAR